MKGDNVSHSIDVLDEQRTIHDKEEWRPEAAHQHINNYLDLVAWSTFTLL